MSHLYGSGIIPPVPSKHTSNIVLFPSLYHSKKLRFFLTFCRKSKPLKQLIITALTQIKAVLFTVLAGKISPDFLYPEKLFPIHALIAVYLFFTFVTVNFTIPVHTFPPCKSDKHIPLTCVVCCFRPQNNRKHHLCIVEILHRIGNKTQSFTIMTASSAGLS